MSKVLSGGKLAGGNPTRGRVDNDYYATAPKDTLAFLDKLESDGLLYEIFADNSKVLEPCAGEGHITKVLLDKLPSMSVVESDLVVRKDGVMEVDFLESQGVFADGEFPVVMTNPPFKIAKEIIDRALEVSSRYVLMFAKLSLLEGISRKEWFESEVPLRYVYVYSFRANPLRNGSEVDENGKKWASSTMAFAWFVFDKAYSGEPVIRWI